MFFFSSSSEAACSNLISLRRAGKLQDYRHLHVFILFLHRQMEEVLCYETRNNSCLRTVRPLPVRLSLYAILGVVVILTVCGNLLVTLSVAYFKQLHTPTNYLIVSLAMSDLLLGLVVMFPSMVTCVESCWYFGELFCKVYLSSDVTLCTASILNLSFISLDRHYAVCQPLLYRRKITVSTVGVMILLSWSISLFIGFGMIFLRLNILGVEEFYYNNIACEGGCALSVCCLSSLRRSPHSKPISCCTERHGFRHSVQ
uniref:Trace amine-associated receptor 10b n=1 Tax=Salarias fasciatus TaxID=181472 RepID=A0A672FI16_SALFA